MWFNSHKFVYPRVTSVPIPEEHIRIETEGSLGLSTFHALCENMNKLLINQSLWFKKVVMDQCSDFSCQYFQLNLLENPNQWSFLGAFLPLYYIQNLLIDSVLHTSYLNTHIYELFISLCIIHRFQSDNKQNMKFEQIGNRNKSTTKIYIYL